MNSNWFLIDYTWKKDLQGNSGFKSTVDSDTELSKQEGRKKKKSKDNFRN